MAQAVKTNLTGQAVKFDVSSRAKTMAIAMIGVGLLTFGFGLTKDPTRVWTAYLAGFFFVASLGLGGLFFTAIQHVTNAHWSVSVRRIAEAMTVFIPWAAVLGIVLMLVGGKDLYSWLQPERVANDPLIQKKTAYLNQTFFWVRVVAFFGLWILFSRLIVRKSLAQDQTGDVKLTLNAVKPSVIFLIVFALSYSLFSVDFLMSLDPHWFSTMFGVYCFAGLFQSSLAMIILFTIWMMRKGVLQGYVNENHLHDLGKLLFAFTVFYAYIAFSQFMLIWYANIPEETLFYLHRAHGIWYAISLSLLGLKFIVPFLALMPRGNKRNPTVMVPVAILILIMQYVDIYWLIYPNFNDGHVVFSFWEVGMFVGMLGAFLFAVYGFFAKYSAVPVKDPRLAESLHHHT